MTPKRNENRSLCVLPNNKRNCKIPCDQNQRTKQTNTTRPRSSPRKQPLDELDRFLEAANEEALLLCSLGAEHGRLDDAMCSCRSLQRSIQNQRYLFTRGKCRKRTDKFHLCLSAETDDCLSDSEFKFHFRVSREAFSQLVRLLQHHPAFQRKNSDSRGPPPKPVEQQLLVLLKCCGSEGNQSSSVALSTFFGVAKGVIDNCRTNALEGLSSLEDLMHIWPDAEERKVTSTRIKEQCLFPNCIGFIDGTLLPLAHRPILHGENYLSRKKFYAIVMLVVCDDNSRMLCHHIGWPGSVHDNGVWRNCKLNKRPGEFFSNGQYLLGDSAFTASAIMVPPFKNTAGGSLSSNKNAFNTLLSKPRVKSEHCIGILKGRFPFLKQIHLKLGNKIHMQRIIKHSRGCVVLHNFLRDEDDDDEDWIDPSADVEGDDDLDPEPFTDSNAPNYARRDELFFYLSELEDTPIN